MQELALARHLLREGLLHPERHPSLGLAMAERTRSTLPLLRHLMPEQDLLHGAAVHFSTRLVDLRSPPPDLELIERIGAARCMNLGLVPWRREGARVVIAASRPEEFARMRPELEAALGPIALALAPAGEVETAILRRCGAALAAAAESRTPAPESCRDLDPSKALPLAVMLASPMLALLLWPQTAMLVGLVVALTALFAGAALRVLAMLATLRTPAAKVVEAVPEREDTVPVISIILALYRESDIAARLIRRLSRLDYPRDRLEVILAIEEEDRLTRNALSKAQMPDWMRIVTVPAGRVKTKPRALNFALNHCRGSIIGVYDAEDAPDPAQLRLVADHFARAAADVACLQGRLDFYNPGRNWLARCFTFDYAAWFRVILPGIARLGLIVPLGGTTLFFRREVLEGIGAWDAHNVTEDADLGVRLVRHGWRTELLASTTMEEANCHPLAWVRQRSRWIKGYMMTWIVHMRQPMLLWRQIGAWRFLGFQIMFLGSILSSLLAPLVWSLWLIAFGLPHPLAEAVTGPALAVLLLLMSFLMLSDHLILLIGLRRSRQPISPFWIAALQIYFPMATLAAYKALWEVIFRPFYWDKTSHGLFHGSEGGG